MYKLLACLLGTYVSLSAIEAPVADEDQKCSIEGRIVNSVTGDPLPRALVVLGTGDARSIKVMLTVKSDDKGQFVFHDVNPGRYVLRAERAGFVNQTYGAKAVSRNPTQLALSAGQKVTGLLYRLPPAAAITGRVLDPEGEPMEHANVVALRSGYERGRRQWTTVETALTNDLGEFRLARLASGSYVVAVNLGFSLWKMLETDRAPKVGHITTYYPGAADAVNAVPVHVQAGGESRLPDIRMLSGPMVRVRGRLAGVPVSGNATVRLASHGAAPLGLQIDKSTVVRQEEGAFELGNVPSGSYVLTARSNDGQARSGGQLVQVGEQDIEGIVLQLSPTGSLPGVVSVEGRSSPSLERTAIALYPVEREGSSPSVGYADPGGRFTIKDVGTGRYRVEVSSEADSFYVKSMRLGGREITGEELDLTGGVTGALEVTLSPETAQVDGVVQDSDNRPVSGATVVFAPDPSRSTLFKEEVTDQFGAFTVRGLAPGEYKLLAWEDIESGAYQDPEILRRYEGKAESLSLEPNDRKRVQLRAIPAETLP